MLALCKKVLKLIRKSCKRKCSFKSEFSVEYLKSKEVKSFSFKAKAELKYCSE